MADVRSRRLFGNSFVDALERPIAEATGLPGQAYASKEFFDLENERLFPHKWVAAASANDIPNPGDVTAVVFAERPLIVVRNEDGIARAFYNICRHRGMQIVSHPRRKMQALRCPFHGWTYDLDGKLIATPNLGGPGIDAQEGFEQSKVGLEKVRAAEWMNVIFLNFDGKAPPFEEHITPFIEHFAAYDFSLLRHAHSTRWHFKANWKLCIESGMEDYHLPVLHRQIFGTTTQWQSRTVIGGECFAGVIARFSAGQGGLSGDGTRLPRFPSPQLDPEDLVGFVNLFPNMAFSIYPDHVVSYLFVPVNHQETTARFDYYFIGDEAMSSGLASGRKQIIAAWEKVWDQDQGIVEALQSSHEKRDRTGVETQFSPVWEEAVYHFQRLIIKTTKGSA